MNVVLIALGCVLMALGLVMLANRSGYLYFVVGPRSVLILAGAVAIFAFWIQRRLPDKACLRGKRLRQIGGTQGPVKPPDPMLYIP